jgi:hypothetical protein
VAEGAGFDFATDQSGSRMIFCMTALAVAPVGTSAGGAGAGGYSGHGKISHGGMISRPIVRNRPFEAAARHPACR